MSEWRKQSTVFEGLAGRGWDRFTLTGRGLSENISGSRLSANIFPLLGIKPLLGRDFQPEEELTANIKSFFLVLNFGSAGLAQTRTSLGKALV